MQAKVDSPVSMLPTSSRTLASEPRVVVFKYVFGIDTQIKVDEYLHESHEKTHVSQTPKLEKAWPSSQTMPGLRNKSVLSNEDLFNPDLSPSIQRWIFLAFLGSFFGIGPVDDFFWVIKTRMKRIQLLKSSLNPQRRCRRFPIFIYRTYSPHKGKD
jgi:hypothetical protein